MASCVYCYEDCGESRLTRCQHPAHAKCIAKRLVASNRFKCMVCLAKFKANDFYNIISYKKLFTPERLKELYKQLTNILMEDLDPDDWSDGDLPIDYNDSDRN